MEKKVQRRALLCQWLDPIKDADTINATCERLKVLRTPRDIAYGVVSQLLGKGKITSKIISSQEFIDALIKLSPKLKDGITVDALRKQINLMKEVMDWNNREQELEKAKSVGNKGGEIFLHIKYLDEKDYSNLQNFLTNISPTAYDIYSKNFDGEGSEAVPVIKITGCPADIAKVLSAIEQHLGGDLGRIFKYVSPQNQFERDNLTLAQALAIANSEIAQD